MSKKSIFGAAAILLSLGCTHIASAEETETWHNEVTVYGWLAGLDAAINMPVDTTTEVEFDASDIIDNLKMVLMGVYKGKYDKWSVFADVVYMDVGDDASTVLVSDSGTPVSTTIDLDMKSLVLSGAVGYEVVHSDSASLSVVGGVRYLDVEVDVDFYLQGVPLGVNDSKGLLDGLIGLSGAFNLSENWYIPYHADIGTGGTDFSWQVYAAVGYRFGWGDVLLGYRYLRFDIGDDDIVIDDLEISGPVLGVGFKF